MFGIKLDEELDRRISEYARSKGQAKSEIGRRALIEYLDRHALEEEFKRQIGSLAGEDLSYMEELERMAFQNPEWK
ncbi:MAG TPA: ribbon-helix-helix domain-containing protein [Sphingomicrobium sp.]|nr:ribbon-helix-helix domain-containing protein [Sphingomicrobium sp.]